MTLDLERGLLIGFGRWQQNLACSNIRYSQARSSGSVADRFEDCYCGSFLTSLDLSAISGICSQHPVHVSGIFAKILLPVEDDPFKSPQRIGVQNLQDNKSCVVGRTHSAKVLHGSVRRDVAFCYQLSPFGIA